MIGEVDPFATVRGTALGEPCPVSFVRMVGPIVIQEMPCPELATSELVAECPTCPRTFSVFLCGDHGTVAATDGAWCQDCRARVSVVVIDGPA